METVIKRKEPVRMICEWERVMKDPEMDGEEEEIKVKDVSCSS